MVSSTKRERSRSAPSAQHDTPALKVVKRKRATSLPEQRRSGFFYGISDSGEYQHPQPQLENILDKLADHMSRFHISMPEDQPENMTATADQATSGSARVDTPNPDFSSTPASSAKLVAESSHRAAFTWEEMNNLPLGDWADEVADNQKAQPPRASSSNSDVKAPAANDGAPEDGTGHQNGADKIADHQKPEVSSPKDGVKPADHLRGPSDYSAVLRRNQPPQGSLATEIQAEGTADASDDCTDLLNGQAAEGCPPPEDTAQGTAEISLPSYDPEEEKEEEGNLLCCPKHNIQLCSVDLRVQFRRQLLERAIFKAETRSRSSGRRSPYTVPSPSNLCEGKKAWQPQSSTQQASQQPVKEQNLEPLRNDTCGNTLNEMDRHRFYKTMLTDFEQALADLQATDPSKQPTLHLFEKRDALRKYQLHCLSNNSDRLMGELNYAQELANDWYSRCFEANNQLAHAERRIEVCERNAEEAINEWLKLQEEQKANLETARQDRLRHEQDQQTIRQLEERLRYADEDKIRLKELERQHEKDRQDARALAEAHSRKSEEDKRTIAQLTEQLRLSQSDNVQIRKSASQSCEEEEKAVEQSVPIVKAH